MMVEWLNYVTKIGAIYCCDSYPNELKTNWLAAHPERNYFIDLEDRVGNQSPVEAPLKSILVQCYICQVIRIAGKHYEKWFKGQTRKQRRKIPMTVR